MLSVYTALHLMQYAALVNSIHICKPPFSWVHTIMLPSEQLTPVLGWTQSETKAQSCRPELFKVSEMTICEVKE